MKRLGVESVLMQVTQECRRDVCRGRANGVIINRASFA